MPQSSSFVRPSIVVAALASLAACSGAGPGNAIPASAVAVARGEARKTVVSFASDWNNDAVYVQQQGQQLATLHVDGPQGLAVDGARNLYVTDVAYSNVLVYPPPYTGSTKTLDDAGYRPSGVCVDGNGNVAITSYTSNSYGPGSVALYAKGATSPTKTIVGNGKFAGDYYCAFDANGNLYVDSKSGSGPFEVGEVAGGIAGKSVTPLRTANIIQNPGGIQITANGQIAILDQRVGSGGGPTIYTYDPPNGHSLGKPAATTSLGAANDAIAFAFSGPNDSDVLTADTFLTDPAGKRANPNHETPVGQFQTFAYPGGRLITKSPLPDNAVLLGVAVSR